MQQVGTVVSRHGLDLAGLANVAVARWNLGVPALYEQAIRRREGLVAEGGALAVRTGVNTGRSPRDKFFADEAESRANIWWGAVNVAMPEERFVALHRRFQAYFQGREAFVQDCHAGADPDYRLKARVVTETAWHSLFARNMFIRPSHDALADFAPDFTIVHAPNFHSAPAIDGTNSEVAIALSFKRKLVLIAGSHYAGEIKKSVFTILNYLLPEKGVLPMHAAANIGPRGDTAIFFGLSGTGKTTLSADPARRLIGDDEHGWSDGGVFNFEGGCYAKAIKLSAEAEPEIHAATHRFGTVLENVVVDADTRRLDLDDERFTENTRASYPIGFIPNAAPDG
ncbi:MAG: phosphoenolpyruvate carboxykinase (ATP), partial [Rhodospirillales bacterium]